MTHLSQPPAGYPLVGGAHVPLVEEHNKPPEAQFFTDESQRPFICSGLFATSPLVCLVSTGQNGQLTYMPLKLKSARLNLECHIATVFCDLEMIVDGSTLPGGEGVLFLPKHYDATITEITIENLNRDSMYTTILIPKDDTERYATKLKNDGQFQDIETDADPELFVLPFSRLEAGDSIKIQINWFQPLDFENGKYKMTLPLSFPQVALAPDVNLARAVKIECTINTGVSQPVDFKIPSHPMLLTEEIPGRVVLTGDSTKHWENTDFIVSYNVWGDAIVASLNVQPLKAGKSAKQEPCGTFSLSVSPPGPDAASSFQRSIVYLIDRSGSMKGQPLEYAKRALSTALHMLEFDDQFTIIAYDHEQIAWTAGLVDATQENVKNGLAWVQNTVEARGLTDIMTPLQHAMSMLHQARGIPYIFLMTDGAVENEREIARYLQSAVQAPGPSTVLTPRVSAFAIGPYCNHYFLKQLAVIGRGQFDVAFRPHGIQFQVERMLRAASMPVLTEVSITMANLTAVELYPFPIPDLFVGLPVLISGKYSGHFPDTITLNGRLPNGEVWTQVVNTTQALFIPLERVFIKQRLDILTAAAWMQDNDPRFVQQIVDLSIQSSVPCMHTSMVGIQTTDKRLEQMKKEMVNGNRVVPSKYAVGGVAAVSVIAGVGLAIGFGDLGASLSNIPVLDALAGGLGDALAVPADAFGDCCGECFDGIGNCCGECFGCFQDVFDVCGGICGI